MPTPRLRLLVSPISPFPYFPFAPIVLIPSQQLSLMVRYYRETRSEISHMREDIFAKPLKRLHDLVMCHATKVDLGQDVG